jgi:NAD(P)-dependent dehydrogenase (short-subunit alcohol dehydrogenase family)
MTQQFAGRTALVTGGGSGIGRATALALAVRVNALCPGLVETPMIASMDPAYEPMKSILAAHPIGRIAQATEEIPCTAVSRVPAVIGRSELSRA